MEYLKEIFIGILNICVLLYVVAGIGLLMLLTIGAILFCWTSTVSNAIKDMYTEVSKDLKEFF